MLNNYETDESITILENSTDTHNKNREYTIIFLDLMMGLVIIIIIIIDVIGALIQNLWIVRISTILIMLLIIPLSIFNCIISL